MGAEVLDHLEGVLGGKEIQRPHQRKAAEGARQQRGPTAHIPDPFFVGNENGPWFQIRSCFFVQTSVSRHSEQLKHTLIVMRIQPRHRHLNLFWVRNKIANNTHLLWLNLVNDSLTVNGHSNPVELQQRSIRLQRDTIGGDTEGALGQGELSGDDSRKALAVQGDQGLPWGRGR